MKNSIQFMIVLYSAFIMLSCTTVKVAKVSPGSKTEGLRYSLGKPLIKVTPNAAGDGTYAAELIYLPDIDRTYAVSASTFMSKQTLELNVDGSGILSKISLSRDATAIASEGAGALGEMAKTEIERRKKEAKEKQDKIDAEIKANKDALKAAKEARDEKRIQVAANDRDIAVLEATSPTPLSDEVKDKIRQLNSTNFKLELEIQSLDRKIGDLESSVKGLEGAANIAVEKIKDLTSYGPVFFQIKEEVKEGKLSVTLEPVEQDGQIQRKFKTVEKPGKPEAPAASEPVPVPVMLSKNISAKLNADNTFSFKLTFDNPVLRIDKSRSFFDSDPVVKLVDFKDEEEENESIKLTTKAATTLKPGKYVVTIKFFYSLGGTNGEASSSGTVLLTLKK